MQKEIRNIGIFAHVDAGKTTITENLLFLSGATKKLGNVDSGTTASDSLEVEKERGISVKANFFSFEWKDITINLYDTPGHIDFSSDVERSLRIIDAAILIISASEGVQAHTETIWHALNKKNIPVILFINKIDRIGVDIVHILTDIKKELTKDIFLFHEIENEGTSQVQISATINNDKFKDEQIETIATHDEVLLEKYFDDENLSFEEIDASLKMSIQKGVLTPVLFGSSKFQIGISDLLDISIKYLPKIERNESDNLSAIVCNVTYDKSLGKLTTVKVFQGVIKNRETIKNTSNGQKEKIVHIRKPLGNKLSAINEVEAGDIALISGLSHALVGDILGEKTEEIPEAVSLQAPLLTVQVKPEIEKDYPSLAEALKILAEEDPALQMEWLKEERELHIQIMGQIQIEVLKTLLEQRFELKAIFENPTIIYKETPSSTGEGFVRYWMPKPCWAILKFKIEPGEPGSGVTYSSQIGVNDVKQRYQNEVERTIPEALKQGIKGWEVTDIRITLIEGEDHEMHSRAGDFAIATPMGIMNGLKEIGTTLLEPLISYKIIALESLLGSITSDITQMRGSFESPEFENENVILKGILPVASSLEYPIKLSSLSGGKAKYSTQFFGYAKCADQLGVIRPYKGISPLDEAKYILKARKALQ